MPSVKDIQDRIEEVNHLLSTAQRELAADPDNLPLQITISTWEKHINELQQQLRQENKNRFKEVISLRFKGEPARFGSMPLNMVGGLTSSFAKAIHQSSKFFQYGTKTGGKLDAVISETIDLRLEGIGKGSTVFFISGKTSPDLFGKSIIQGSLENTFSLLNSNDPETVINNINNIGPKSVKHFADFFKELAEDNLEVDISWQTPAEDQITWEGSKDRILSLHNTLTSLVLNEPEEITFSGEIITLSLKGKIEILQSNNRIIYSTFPNEMTEVIKSLHVGAQCTGTLLRTTIINNATGKEKHEFELKDIQITE